jgi:hypothetical protein
MAQHVAGRFAQVVCWPLHGLQLQSVDVIASPTTVSGWLQAVHLLITDGGHGCAETLSMRRMLLLHMIATLGAVH